MGNKDKGKKETKKVAKKQPKPPPGRARGDITRPRHERFPVKSTRVDGCDMKEAVLSEVA